MFSYDSVNSNHLSINSYVTTSKFARSYFTISSLQLTSIRYSYYSIRLKSIMFYVDPLFYHKLTSDYSQNIVTVTSMSVPLL